MRLSRGDSTDLGVVDALLPLLFCEAGKGTTSEAWRGRWPGRPDRLAFVLPSILSISVDDATSLLRKSEAGSLRPALISGSQRIDDVLQGRSASPATTEFLSAGSPRDRRQSASGVSGRDVMSGIAVHTSSNLTDRRMACGSRATEYGAPALTLANGDSGRAVICVLQVRLLLKNPMGMAARPTRHRQWRVAQCTSYLNMHPDGTVCYVYSTWDCIDGPRHQHRQPSYVIIQGILVSESAAMPSLGKWVLAAEQPAIANLSASPVCRVLILATGSIEWAFGVEGGAVRTGARRLTSTPSTAGRYILCTSGSSEDVRPLDHLTPEPGLPALARAEPPPQPRASQASLACRQAGYTNGVPTHGFGR